VQAGVDQGGGGPVGADLSGQGVDRRVGEPADPARTGEQPGQPDRQQHHRDDRDRAEEGDRGGVQRQVPPAQRPERCPDQPAPSGDHVP